MEHRVERVRELLIREISDIVRNHVKDPRIPEFLTITDAKVSKDLQQAIIYFGVSGNPGSRNKAQEALNSASNFMRSILKERVSLRYIPYLKFIYDESIDRADRINTILKTIERENKDHQGPEEGKPEDGKDQ